MHVTQINGAPDEMYRKKLIVYNRIYKAIVNKEDFSQADLQIISKPEQLSPVTRLFIPMSNFFWNAQLKKNGAYTKRFDKPYL